MGCTKSLPVHARTGDRALGYWRDGRPIWPIRGGSGEGGDHTAPLAPAGDPAPAPAPAAPPAADPAAEQQLTEATTAPSRPRPSATSCKPPSTP